MVVAKSTKDSPLAQWLTTASTPLALGALLASHGISLAESTHRREHAHGEEEAGAAAAGAV